MASPSFPGQGHACTPALSGAEPCLPLTWLGGVVLTETRGVCNAELGVRFPPPPSRLVIRPLPRSWGHHNPPECVAALQVLVSGSRLREREGSVDLDVQLAAGDA